jgi:phosphoserine phosphatase
MGEKIRVAVFDMDGTLLEEKSCWGVLHRRYGTEEVGMRGLELYSRGALGYEDWMRMDVSAWPKGLRLSEVDDALSNYTLKEGARETVGKLRGAGVEVAMITAGLDVLARRVASDLGIKHWLANSLKTDGSGRLTGEGVGVVEPSRKELALAALLMRLSRKRSETIAVGDSVYDLSILRAARVGFLLHQDKPVGDPSIVHIERLGDIFEHDLLKS